MADRGRVGNDLQPNRAIREQHLSTIRGIHESRMAKMAKGHGLVNDHLEAKFCRTRTGAKTMLLRKERADSVALENKLLVERMSRIITHSKPVWCNEGPNSAIKIDHLSVLRPIKNRITTKNKKVDNESLNSDNLNVYNPETDASEAPADSWQQQQQKSTDIQDLALSFNLEVSRGSNSKLDTSAVSITFRDHPIAALEESYVTAPVGSKKKSIGRLSLPRRPISASSKAFSIYSSMPRGKSAKGQDCVPRPSTAGPSQGRRNSRLGTAATATDLRPRSASTAPPLAVVSRRGKDFFVGTGGSQKDSEKVARKGMNVGSITGLSRLRHYEKIAADNKKIIRNMDAIVAYYNKDDWEEDRKNQIARMERFKKFRTTKDRNGKIMKAGLKEMMTFAKKNEKKIREWEESMEVRMKNEALQRVGKGKEYEAAKKRKARRDTQMERKNQKMKKEYIEQKRREREEEEKKRTEEEEEAVRARVSDAARRELLARRGIARAASKFSDILVEVEEKKKHAAKQLSLMASIASRECLKHLQKRSSRDFSDADGIKMVRKTLVQGHHDQLIDNYIRSEQAKGAGKGGNSAKGGTTTDYMDEALEFLARNGRISPVGNNMYEDESKEGSGGAEGGSKGQENDGDFVVGGEQVFDQPKLIDGRSMNIKCFREGDIVVSGQAKTFASTVSVSVESAEEIMVVVEYTDDFGELDDAMASNGGKQVNTRARPRQIRMRQKVPKLAVVERDAGISYAETFIGRLQIVKRKKREIIQGKEAISGWMDWKLEVDDSNSMI